MKTLLVTVFVLAVVGCDGQTNPAHSVQAPVKFELRDFKAEKITEEHYVTVKARGILFTKDPRLAQGTYMVWVSLTKGHQNDRQQRHAVVLQDGIGNLETQDRLDHFNALTESPEYSNWRVHGYIALQPGELAPPNSSASVPR